MKLVVGLEEGIIGRDVGVVPLSLHLFGALVVGLKLFCPLAHVVVLYYKRNQLGSH